MTDIEFYELIGALANAAVANGNTKLKLSELAAIFTVLDIESTLWNYYKNRTDTPIKNAYAQFSNAPTQTTADNIKKTYIKKDGTPLIP